jgi:V/A-type H+-transporting ATPase subunit E
MVLMNSEEESIQSLAHAVLAEANRDVEQILAEARQKADQIRAEAQNQAEAERTKILEHASQEAERIHSQAIATAHLRARTLKLEQRELLLNKVFEQARQKLASIQKGPDYEKVAIALLKEALAHLGSNTAIILADMETQKIFTTDVLASVEKEIGAKLELGKPLQKGMGMIVQTKDGHRQYDNTFETRLMRMQDSLRNPVYRLLMGEST